MYVNAIEKKNGKVTPSGSYPEGCSLPPYWVKDNETGKNVLKLSDVDLMFSNDNGITSVGFDRRDGNGIVATVDTTETAPGYLRLRGYDGNYVHNDVGFQMTDYTGELLCPDVHRADGVQMTDRCLGKIGTVAGKKQINRNI